MARLSTLERLLASVNVDESGCWRWQRTLGVTGYPNMSGPGKSTRRAHRVAYELLVGPIPEGLYLDHLCRVRDCVNPQHLEPVTNRENVLRGISPSAKNAVKAECLRGHAFTPDNTTLSRGRRICRTCHRAKLARLRAKARAA